MIRALTRSQATARAAQPTAPSVRAAVRAAVEAGASTRGLFAATPSTAGAAGIEAA